MNKKNNRNRITFLLKEIQIKNKERIASENKKFLIIYFIYLEFNIFFNKKFILI